MSRCSIKETCVQAWNDEHGDDGNEGGDDGWMDVLVMEMMVVRIIIIIVLYQRDMGLNIIIPQCLYYENNDDGLGPDNDDGDNVDTDVHEDGADANLQVPRALSQDGNEHGE